MDTTSVIDHLVQEAVDKCRKATLTLIERVNQVDPNMMWHATFTLYLYYAANILPLLGAYRTDEEFEQMMLDISIMIHNKAREVRRETRHLRTLIFTSPAGTC